MSRSTASRHRRSIVKRAGLTFALALGALAVVPAIASAATVSITGTTITFEDTGLEVNGVTVTVVGANYRFADGSGPDPTAGAGCTDTGATVDCPLDPTTAVTVLPGAFADTFTAAGVSQDPFTITDTSAAFVGSQTFTGSEANDTISSGAASDTLSGGGGNDTITGGDGDDAIDGGTGNDRFNVGFNNGDTAGDELTGGADIDRAIYTTCATSVQVVIDGANNDGGTCGNGSTGTDDVHTDVESITGSNNATDTLTGSCSPNTIAGDSGTTNGGAGGADTINGDAAVCAPNGGDFLGGGEGNDVFNCDGSGAAGFDTVTYGTPYTGFLAAVSVTLDDAANDNDGFGNAGDNVNGDCERIIGSPGADTIDATGADQAVQLFGRAGDDTLTDGPGDDLLNGEADTDTANCVNAGSDTAVNVETNNGCEL
jgi:RTX calcium-binding nonapeptide repeat (4 copies)